MPTKMVCPDMEYVEPNSENSQRVAVLDAPYKIHLDWAKIPEPSDDEVRIKIKYVGICG